MFQTTTSLRKIIDLKKSLRIIQGGTAASKTFSIIAILIEYAIRVPDLEISIVSESIPHIRRGALRDFLKIMKWTDRYMEERFNRSLLTYTFNNGSKIEMFSADQDAKLRGARRQILFCNEANNLTWESFYQLKIRTSDVTFIDYNPTTEFWVHDEYKNDPNADWLILTYKDNESAPEATIKEIEKAKQKGDSGNQYWKNWYRVYGLGLPGIYQGAVYSNWKEGMFVDNGDVVFGQDFGWSDSPTCLLKVSFDKKQKIIYAQECFYKTGLTQSQIAELNYKFANDSLIIGDSAEPRLINALATGNPKINIIPATKGADSVNFGISLIQDYDLIVSGENLIKELKSYVWLAKGVPQKKNDHLLDCLRMVAIKVLSEPKGEYHIW